MTAIAETQESKKSKKSKKKPNPNVALGAGAQVGPLVLGVEVVQSVQSLNNDVVLIADKPTLVRVYLNPAKAPANTRLTGEVMWRREGAGGMAYLPALNVVTFNGAALPPLQEQRLDLALSLNFKLPPEAIKQGKLELQLNRVYSPGGPDLADAGMAIGKFEFEPAPVLRVRAIGLRYRSRFNPGEAVSPDAIHFAYMKSYLLRAYPIAEINWSQIVIDATPGLKPPFRAGASNIANGQLSMLRKLDLAAGTHARTHYYGLVDDDKGRNPMRGSAVLSQSNIFEFVASGPAGRPNGWAGDHDASFADWYSAHELGHTFQRRHPGFPRDDQDKDPADQPGFPYADGCISPPADEYVGLDMGDPDLGLPMKALRGTDHFDFMTYEKNQWVCDYTYKGVLHELRREEADFGA